MIENGEKVFFMARSFRGFKALYDKKPYYIKDSVRVYSRKPSCLTRRGFPKERRFEGPGPTMNPLCPSGLTRLGGVSIKPGQCVKVKLVLLEVVE